MTRRVPEQMSRAELVAYLHELEGQLRDDAERRALVHDLQVHQEELEAQQRQLIETQQALETARDRYADLFDFAPLGYVMLDLGGYHRRDQRRGAPSDRRERPAPGRAHALRGVRRRGGPPDVPRAPSRAARGGGASQTEVRLRPDAERATAGSSRSTAARGRVGDDGRHARISRR